MLKYSMSAELESYKNLLNVPHLDTDAIASTLAKMAFIANMAQDFTPIVGDAKGFYEAETRFDYALAILGLAPVGGDVASALVKEAKALHEAGDAVKAAEKLAEAKKEVNTIAKNSVLPPLRQAYVDEVAELRGIADSLKAAGADIEQIATALSAERRAIGVKYKDMTPPDKLAVIYERNLKLYGDKLGPTVEWFRNEKKLSWEEIPEKALRPGGGDLGF